MTQVEDRDPESTQERSKVAANIEADLERFRQEGCKCYHLLPLCRLWLILRREKKPEKSRVSREVFFSSTKIDIVLFDSCAVDAVDHL